jgi:hypothetical protein
MSHVHARPLFAPTMVLLTLAVGLVATMQVAALARQPGAKTNRQLPPGEQTGKGAPEVPPLPEGTPEQLMQFVDKIKQANFQPSNRQEMMAYMKDVAAVSLQAADKILAQVKPADALHDKAAKLKLESLMMLGRLGDEKAAAAMATYAASLVDSPSPTLAKEARMLVLVSDAQKVLSQQDVAGGQDLVKRMAALLAADPNDVQTAGLAMQLAGAFEHMTGGDELAAAAYKAFGPALAKSSNEQIRGMGESFAGTLRRLSLPGNPMEIKGTLLSGKAFDQKSLAGKVVLVDFEQYEKYHDKGFEVVGVSLDQDREALEKFVAEQKIPWPILFEKPEGEGWQHPLATFYGITGIPTVVLIGRDGKVITLDARGEKLGDRLDELFKKG